MAQHQNAREQYTAPEPMRVELKNQSHADRVSRLVTLLGTPSRANFKTFDRLDRRLKFIREVMLPMGHLPLATCCNKVFKRCTNGEAYVDLNCRECNHEACPYCYCRTTTIPGPGFAEWEAELLKIGKDGMHISDHISWHNPLSTKTANEYQKFRDILKRQEAWCRTHAICCRCKTQHPWKSCPRCNHYICSMCFDGVEHVKYPTYEEWLSSQEKEPRGYHREENVEVSSSCCC
ncbi:hypothetical protein L207DRAFT_517408 [Hyaloscypha variabilis F]|uniref:Uncharacterized protein n=1 Tax=Hyaloscypha variabilis (strain UAMH 11265 / GT02V1 / F) TaxID=1149755 RepID=A0A2J6R6Q4_HYAVF|nr:hypothetical protein L207DRAFT_517408 [Hyaloscypha variabilis F]